MKLPKAWPKVVGRGHSAVKIYLTPSNGCDQFTVSYYLAQKRVRKTCAELRIGIHGHGVDLEEAFGGRTERAGVEGQGTNWRMCGQWRSWGRRGFLLRWPPFTSRRCTRFSRGGILKAARYFAKHHPKDRPSKTVPEAVEAARGKGSRQGQRRLSKGLTCPAASVEGSVP